MKKSALILMTMLALLFPNISFAQGNNQQPQDSTSTVAVIEDELVIKKDDKGNLDLTLGGYSILLSDNEKAKLKYGKRHSVSLGFIKNLESGITQTTPAPSSSPYAKALDFKTGYHFALTFIEINVDLDKKGIASLYIGTNLTTNSYIYDKYMLDDSEDILASVPIEEGYKQSKLNTFYMGVPIGIEFDVIHGLKIIPEVSFNFLTKAHTIQKSPKVKTDFSGISKFDITTSLKVKYEWIGFYFKFTPTSLFASDVMPKVMPYSVGIVIF